MNKKDIEKTVAEWKVILKNHPTFARVFLSQQAILMEASQLGFKLIDRSMFQLAKKRLPILFENYWTSRWNQQFGEIRLNDQLECILENNRDPARCFNLDPGDPPWFDDPLAGGHILPPKPPVPPLRPR
jgi:hypothetical protein